MELSKIAKITNFLLKLFILAGIICIFFMKKIILFLGLLDVTFYTTFFILIMFLCLYIVYEITKVFKSVEQGNPFVRANEIALKKIAVTCEVISMLLVIRLIIDTHIYLQSSVLLTIIFTIAGLCAYIFSQLFKQSAIIKEENDMTI